MFETNGFELAEIESKVLKAIPLVTVIGFVLGFLYEWGFCLQLGVSMHDLLEISDLARTSLFCIIFAGAILFVVYVSLIIDILETDGLSGEKFKNIVASSILFKIVFPLVATLEFGYFLLFGGEWITSTWFFIFIFLSIFRIVVTIDNICKARKLRISIWQMFTLFAISFLAIYVFQQGAHQANKRLTSEKEILSAIVENGKNWTVVRRYNSHLVVYNGGDRLALVGLNGDKVFSWPYVKRGWAGFLCDTVPDTSYPSFRREGCRGFGTDA